MIEPTPVSRLRDRLIAEFPELPPGLVLRQLARAHMQLHRLQPGEGLADAVELLTRQRLLRLLQARQQPTEHPGS